jgi:2'-5' RNA ligase
MSITSTFIVTLELDGFSFERLEAWRQQHFPAHRNFLQAHLTLFHTLSMAQVERLVASQRNFESNPPVRLRFSKVRSLGNGVAIEVESEALQALRAALITTVGGPLTRQDLQRFRPHVTIQNKVDSRTADALLLTLSSQFQPWEGSGTALLVWEYLGGPWRLERTLAFDCAVTDGEARQVIRGS